ncbi:MAG TPA: SDR family NAD(P)-dependent oxidoreductase, partial [Telluria sp.]|nr:SDR family NAD(P)-dependent oxidoreductase [Telluria sp.]
MKAIVTGHTKGLGEAIARELLERGIPVLGLARGSAVELGSDFSRLLREVEIDLSDVAALEQWLASGALANYLAGSGAALLVNNAGVVWPVGPLPAQDPAAVVKAVTLNVAAPLALSSAVAKA